MSQQKWADAATMNCVWLFQTKSTEWNKEHGCRCDLDYDEDGFPEEGSEKKCECSVDVWRTSRVFLLREEARNYGKSRQYDWGKEGEGWRIYGVPCAGEMVELLAKAGVNQAYINAGNIF